MRKEIDSVDNWKIPLYKIYTDDEDVNLITKTIKRGTQWAIGPEIEEFENSIKNYVGCEYCVTLNSGTSALHAALLAYGLGKNDEVIVPSFSFIATANSVLFVDAKPTFADIEESHLGLDPISIKQKITPKTRAVIPVDYAGLPSKIFEIKKISEENNIMLIEDAAEAIGASINGKKIGSIAESSIFSFAGNKILTTGEGGAVVTNSREIYEKTKLIRSHGRADRVNYFNNPQESQYLQLGYNWRMSSLTAAIGISQIKKLDKIIKMRKDNAKYLSLHLSKFKEIKVPSEPHGYDNTFQFYTVRLPNKKIRDNLHEHLTRNSVFSKVYFNPIHLTAFYREKFGYAQGMLPITEKVSQEVLTLPLYPNMTSEEKEYLVDTISSFFESKPSLAN